MPSTLVASHNTIVFIVWQWLVEFAPTFFKTADPTKLSKRKRNEKVEPLFNKYGCCHIFAFSGFD
jgi:hypothetical protein